MPPRRTNRPVGSDLTTRTGEEVYDTDTGAASDLPTPMYQQQTSATLPPVVGRTAYDLVAEKTVTGALGFFISTLDPIEVLAAIAYVLLGIWGKSPSLPMPFWEFIGVFAGYHVILKPISELVFKRSKVNLPVLPPPTKKK